MSAINVIRRMDRSRAAALGLGVWLLCSAFPAFASNVLQQVSHAPGAKGGVDITLQFADPIADAQVFTTDNPPRIAIDLPDTHNGMAERKVAIGTGSASTVSAAEANGRTRVVVDLFRPATYESRIEGNRLVLSVAGSGAVAQMAASQVKGPVMANSLDPSRRVAGALDVANIDFRRGSNGSGRIVIRFSGEGANADMHQEGTRVVVNVGNARIPANLSKHMDVSDFATPVESLDPREQAGGTRLVINTNGAFESSAYQSGNEYVVEIAPKKGGNEHTADDNARIGGVLGTPVYKGKPATFNFQDIPVRTVLQLIAEESNLNIVAADTVSGNVSLRLINVPWDQALDIVLRAKQLDKRQDGGVIWVAPQKELADYEQAKEDARIALEQRAATVTEYIPINYGSAEDIATLLTDGAKNSSGGGGGSQNQQKGFLSPRGSVSFDKRSNTLLLIDLPKKVADIKQLVTLLDRPVDQVLIEARIVIADEEFARDLGAELGINGFNNGSSTITSWGDTIGDTLTTQNSVTTTNVANFNATQAANIATNNSAVANEYAYQQAYATYKAAISGLSQAAADKIAPPVLAPTVVSVPTLVPPSIFHGLNVNLPVANSAGSLAFSILNGGHSLDLELNAMQTEGRGDILSNPRVITSNQKQAIISQGQEIGYVTITGGTAGGAATPNVQFKDVLLQLKVTPTITNDNRVFMALDVTNDELASFLNVANFGDVPQITKRNVTTAVLVDSGQTVVIGGVYQFSSREDLTKIPFLGDLPGLGNLFRTSSKTTNKAELLVFVTPKILQVKQRN
jgi:type IV pilus assembly protein PilQ